MPRDGPSILANRATRHAHHGTRHLADARLHALANPAWCPLAALSPPGDIALEACLAKQRWIRDFRHLPGFIGMAGIRVPPPPEG